MASDIETPVDSSAEEKPKLSLEVNVDVTSACERHVTVAVPRADIERYFKDAFDELQPTAEVPGFRPGKAPRKLVESKFREQMSDRVKGSLLMDSVTQVNEDSDFSAISEPDLDFEAIDLPEDGDMTFEFDIEVRPDFELPEWKNLSLDRPVHEYSDEEVDRHMRTLLKRYGHLKPKDGPAKLGDEATLTITFTDGDTVVSEVKDVNLSVKQKLSFRDGNIEGFDELIAQTGPGSSCETTVKISEDSEQESLRGKDVKAKLTVNSVQETELPELTSAFLDQIGGFEDEDEVREAVRGELQRQLVYHQQQRIRQQIVGILTQSADWELPQALLRRQASRELQRAVLELQSSGFNDEMIQSHANELRQNSQESTARALKEHFILERIAEDEEIDAETDDYDAEIRLIAEQSNESPRRVRARLEKRGEMDALRNQIIERRVIERIVEEATITESVFEPNKDDTVAVDHAISGHTDDEVIPEAKYGGDAEELEGSTRRS